MQVSFRRRNPFAFLFATTKREQYLERYVLRQHNRGRAFAEVIEDAYVRNRSTPEERARLLERPGMVAAIGEHAVAELRLTLSAGALAVRATQSKNEKEDGSAVT
jgi:hypothetical protein